MPSRSRPHLSNLFVLRDSESARSELRQFLLAMACFAFVLAALGAGQFGADAFAKDIILVFSGGWCANQLIRGSDVFKKQVICVLQAYFIGVLCCAFVLFIVGWLIFLPEEYEHLGHALLMAATFTTNFGLAFFPVESGMRFDNLFDHLWIPALIAQCGVILSLLYWRLSSNPIRILTILSGLAGISLILSLIDTPTVQILPIGSLWAFLFGAIPFILRNRYRLVDYATLLGVITALVGVLVTTVVGDSLLARALIAMGLALLYLGSRPRASASETSDMRRRWFGMVLHSFLWAVPLTHLNAALSISGQSHTNFLALIVPCLLFSIFSWTIWQHFEQRQGTNRFVISGVVASVLFINGLIGLTTQGLQVRFPDSAQAYIHALHSSAPAFSCPRLNEGPLAGLEVCKLGPDGPPQALVWGDHQLDTLRVGFSEAARRAEVPTLLISHPNCVPLDGLQTRLSARSDVSGQYCDRQSAQVVQALAHLKSIRHVTLVADWAYYLEVKEAELFNRPVIRLGPTDGSPFDVTRQAQYVADAAQSTLKSLAERGVRISVLRQVPSHPTFDAEIAARASLPGVGLYFGMPKLSTVTSLDEVTKRHAPIDSLFRHFAANGQVTYVDTWDAFCSSTRCEARGGLSSDYITSTRLSPSGALALAPVLAADLRRALTHAPLRRNLDS